MKKITRIISTLVLAFACAATCVGAINVDAASKAVKVSHKTTYNNLKEQMVVKGKDAKGKVVWTYKTGKYDLTELSRTTCKTKNDRVYIFEDEKLTVLKKSNGKKIFSKKVNAGGSPTVYIDKNYNFYIVGYYGSTVYKYNSKGEKVWETDFSDTNSYWPYKMSLSNGQLTVNFEGETGLSVIIFDAKTGTIK